MMGIEIVRDNPREMVVRFTGFSVQFVNAIRRCILRDVMSTTIDSVTFHKNSTCFWDEYISHRLGLMPIEGDGDLHLDVANNGDKIVSVGSDQLVGPTAKVCGVMPIVELGKGDHIKLTVHTRKGCGSEHARFIPCVAYFQNHETHIDMYVETTSARKNAEIFSEGLDKVEQMLVEQKRKILSTSATG
jgi:DNA-directed RNA polymerase subunit D